MIKSLIRAFSDVRVRALFVLNLIAVGVWILDLLLTGFPNADVMLNSPDAKSYMAVGQWIFGGPYTNWISLRPFLFPLLAYFITHSLSFEIFFLIQSLLWLGTVNILFLSTIKLRLPVHYSLLVGVIFSLNLSILTMTYSVLSETVTVFVCCLFAYLVLSSGSIEIFKRRSGVFLFLAAILMLLKPIFEPFFICLLFANIYILFKERNITWRKNLAMWLFLSIIPITVQFFIMIHYTGMIALSGIGDLTLRTYLLSEMVIEINQVNFDVARKLVMTFSYSDIIQLVTSHFGLLVRSYISNVHYNISAIPFEIPAIGSPKYFMNFMIWWNRFHWLAQLALPLAFIFLRKRIFAYPLDAWRFVLLALPMYGVLILSGISAFQGDRLVMPAIPFFICLLAFLIKSYRQPASEDATH